jgi:hypothetical protein
MATLRVYVSAACVTCVTAYERIAQVRQLRSLQPIEVVDLDQVGAERSPSVFGTPTYCLDERVISLGNPSLAALLAELDRATAPSGDSARAGGEAAPGRA